MQVVNFLICGVKGIPLALLHSFWIFIFVRIAFFPLFFIFIDLVSDDEVIRNLLSEYNEGIGFICVLSATYVIIVLNQLHIINVRGFLCVLVRRIQQLFSFTCQH